MKREIKERFRRFAHFRKGDLQEVKGERMKSQLRETKVKFLQKGEKYYRRRR